MAGFAVRFEDQWERDLRRLGLYGPNFDTFWREVEQFIIAAPQNIGQPLLDGSGAQEFLTEEGFPDLPKLVIYFKFDQQAGRLVFLGLDSASLDDDYPSWS